MPTSPKTSTIPPNLNHERSSSISSQHQHSHNHGSKHNSISSQANSRKPSIVELLSSPPPLPTNANNDDINSINLSRANSTSSRTSVELSDVCLTELIESNKLITINSSYSIQMAFETLVKHNLTSLPVSLTKDDSTDLNNCLTFDYSDLNTYMLMIMNKIKIEDLNLEDTDITPELFNTYMEKGKKGEEVPVDFIIKLHPKNPFIKINVNDQLISVMEVLGNGVHRVAIVNDSGYIVGILSQRRLIKFIWENARKFSNLEEYFNQSIDELKIGSSNPITIYGDNLLIEALHKMFIERISSLAVIDRKGNLLANISIVDVKNITSSKESHLLFKSVLNFISFNLSLKGIEEGKDQFPIFHVNKYTGLGRIIAKLVATESHRLWIVESNNVNSSSSSVNKNPNLIDDKPEGGSAGKLIGVITLTDILGFLASVHSNGKKIDPLSARNQRRRSSTSTRSSIDTQEIFRK